MIDKRISKSDKLAALTLERSRTLYFMIYPHLDREGRYSGDPRDIKEDCCPRLPYTLSQVADSLIDLHNVGLIRLYEADNKSYLEADRFDDFQTGLRKDREAPSDIPAYSGPNPEFSGVPPSWSALSLRLRLSLSSISSRPAQPPIKPVSKPKYDSQRTKEIAEVITYLNEKAEKKFNPSLKATAEIINARLNEGRNVDELKKVIDNKVAKWKGRSWPHSETGRIVHGDDYLRPSTLFGPKNFENYVNETAAGEEPKRPLRVGENKKPESAETKASRASRNAYEEKLWAEKAGEIERIRTSVPPSKQRDAMDQLELEIRNKVAAWVNSGMPEGRLREAREGGGA